MAQRCGERYRISLTLHQSCEQLSMHEGAPSIKPHQGQLNGIETKKPRLHRPMVTGAGILLIRKQLTPLTPRAPSNTSSLPYVLQCAPVIHKHEFVDAEPLIDRGAIYDAIAGFRALRTGDKSSTDGEADAVH